MARGKSSDPLHLLSLFRTCFDEDRVDSGPRDLVRSACIQRSSRCHVSCKTKIVWEHSPTRIKRRKRLRINREKLSPINYPNKPLCSATRGAPHGRPRGAWPPAIWRAPCASCVGHTRPATWPQRHVVTARWTRAPRQPVAWARSPRQLRSPRQPQVISPPFFRDFH